MASTSPTYLEQVERWRSDPQVFDAVLMAHQSYLRLRRQPGFEELEAVPFGSPQESPLVALPWTTSEQQQALRRFASFATGPQMQALARQSDFLAPTGIPPEARPPRADGEVLRQAQAQWKRRKDGARTVYLQLVIDRSGSMRQHGRMRQLKKAVAIASGAINPGNQVGLISFGDHPIRHLPLQPYTSALRGRLLAAVEQLEPEGSTAIYDGLAVAVADLMRERQRDPQGRFVVLLLSDGERTSGLTLPELQPVLAQSGITVIPIAYGEVNAQELQELAAIREGSVYAGSPEQIVPLLKERSMTATHLAPWPAGACTAIGPILAATWLAQLSLGLALQAVDPLPQRPLLIERRSCAPGQWQELVERYRGLHHQHQWRQQRLAPVILYGVFGERTLSAPPSPAELLALAGEGVPQDQRSTDLRRRHPGALELRCGSLKAVPAAAGAQ